jgi:hypothetical protein
LWQHPRLPRRDALKILPVDVSSDEEYRVRFEREAISRQRCGIPISSVSTIAATQTDSS